MAREWGGGGGEAFYKSFLENFAGGYLISSFFMKMIYESEKEMAMGNFWRKKGAMNIVMERGS